MGMRGPFLGVSCLRWRWNDGQAVRPPVALNVDISRGSIRCRDGFNTIKRYTNTFKVLGVRGFRTTNGTPLIAALLWDEANQKTLFNVMDMDGTQISTANLDIGVYPLGHPPNPHGYASFEDFGSASGNSLWITTPHGRIHQYDYDDDRKSPHILKTNRHWPASNDKDSRPYLEVLPRASIVHNFSGWTIYSGIDPNQWMTSTIRIPVDQTELPEGYVGNSRETVRYPANVFLVSNPAEPTNVKATLFYDIGAGEKITGLSSLNSRLLIFTDSGVHIADFNPETENPVSQIGPLVRGSGCVSHRTICEGRGRVAWMGRDGFHIWDGSAVQKISDDIEDMFQPPGWEPSPMYSLAKNGPLTNFPWPLRISKAQLDQACGTFDEERQCFWWSVPVDGADADDLEKPSKVCLLYYPHMDSWTIYANTGASTLSPTCLHSFFDGTEHRLIFGDQWGGINVFGGNTSDRNKSSTGARNDTTVSIEWVWQSPPLELDPNMTYAARSLRSMISARGAEAIGLEAVRWHIETERSFDQVDGEMSFSNVLSSSPSADPPESTTRSHIWGGSTWGAFKWHVNDFWRIRKSIHGSIVGQFFRVGFSDSADSARNRNTEIHSFSIEVQPKRDIT